MLNPSVLKIVEPKEKVNKSIVMLLFTFYFRMFVNKQVETA